MAANIWGDGARPTTGRIKSGAQGAYWDPNDSGPDQASNYTQPPAAPANNGPTYQPNGGSSNPPPAAGATDYSGWQSQNVGHDGTTQGGMNREQYRDAWMGSGVTNNAGVDAWLAQNGGRRLNDSGLVMTPYGETLDMLKSAKTGNGSAAWTDQTGGGGAAPGGVPGAAGAAGGLGRFGNTGINGAGIGTGGPMDAMQQQLVNQLMQRSQQTLNINPATDPNIRSQADPYAAAQERGARNFLADQAEKSGPNSNMTGQARVASEHAAQASGLFESGLVGHELDARRNEIQNALTSQQSFLTDQQKMALQRELGYMTDATQRYGIGTQASTAAAGQNIDWQKALMQNQQFGQDLGLRAEDQYNHWDALRNGLLN